MPRYRILWGAYKSLVGHDCLKIHKFRNEMMGKMWQRNYYEHIVRTDDDYARIGRYILSNPINWGTDTLNNTPS